MTNSSFARRSLVAASTLRRRLDLEYLEDRTLLAASVGFDLADIDGDTGSVFYGIDAADDSGRIVESIGDLNGDGYDDFAITAWDAIGDDPDLESVGEVYVIFGTPEGYPATVELASLDGSTGFTVRGHVPDGELNGSVSGIADVNGDGYHDLILGILEAETDGIDTGKAYVLFGKAEPFEAVVDLSNLDGTNGFAINGIEEGESIGAVVGSAGDINGDGFDDILIGSEGRDALSASTGGGAAYVVFGKADGFTAEFDLQHLYGENGFVLFADHPIHDLGESIAAVGDINGDGYDDIAVGSDDWDGNPSSAFFIFGKAWWGLTPSLLTSELDGTNGFVFTAGANNLNVGQDLSHAGDVNGDGIDDVILRENEPPISGPGRAIILFGNAGGFSATVSADSLNGSNGFFIKSELDQVSFGRELASAGDLNADGFDDVLISSHGSPNGVVGAGAVYVVYGNSSFPLELQIANLDGSNGFVIPGLEQDALLSRGLDTAGDVDGDGLPDLLLGEYRADPDGRAGAGKTYLIYGKNFVSSAAQLGDETDNLLTGDASANAFVGGDGNDTIIGNGGADVIYAGAGDDTLVVSDLSFQRIAGGSGFDTLRLEATGQTLDLTALSNSQVSGIEKIDVTGFGANHLTVNPEDVLRLADSDNTLIVRMDVHDTLNIDGFAWNHNEVDEFIGNEQYLVVRSGLATLKVAFYARPNVEFDLDTILVSTQDNDGEFYLREFTEDGTMLRESRIEYGPGDFDRGEENGVRDLVATSRDWVAIFDGAANPHMSTYLPLSYFTISEFQPYWSYSAPGWTTNDDPSTGGIAAYEQFLFVTDMSRTSGNPEDTQAGLRRLNILHSSDEMVRFGEGVDYSDVAVGFDGLLYGLVAGPSAQVDVYDPITLESLRSFSIQSSADVRGIAVDVDGKIYATDYSGAIHRFDENGSLDRSLAVGDINPTDIDLRHDGRIVVGSETGNVIVTDISLDAVINSFSTGSTYNFVSFAFPAYINPNEPAEEAIYHLADLDGSNGFTLNGISKDDQSGLNVGSAGDLNGDGFDDVAIVAPTRNPSDQIASEIYVVFGGDSEFPAQFDLSTLNGVNGFTIRGIADSYKHGIRAKTIGDVNHDGLADLMVTASDADTAAAENAGTAYVIYGATAGFSTEFDLSSLDGSNGFVIEGTAEHSKMGVREPAAVGDVNGDDIDDLLISVYANGSEFWESMVIFGREGGFGATLDLSTIDGSNGFRIVGDSGEVEFGASADGAGDVNGDGFDDIIIFAQDYWGDQAFAFVVFGVVDGYSGVIDRTALDGSNGFHLIGFPQAEESANVVRGLGDVNGDGIDDFLLTAADWDARESLSAGMAYVVFGNPQGFGSSFDVSTLNGSNGFAIAGIDRKDAAGAGASAAGDFNGDGYQDVLIGSLFADDLDKSKVGEIAIVYGGKSEFPAVFELSSLDGLNGVLFRGIDDSDEVGVANSSAGDFNGDGFSDLLIGAAEAAPDERRFAGETYVIFGGAFTSTVTHQGDESDNLLIGDEAANHLVGALGNDTLIGNGDADTLNGGPGDDRLAVSSDEFAFADGGSGTDILQLHGAGINLDLTNPAQRDKLSGIEEIEIISPPGSPVGNLLTLDGTAVFSITESANTLIVRTTIEDQVDLQGSWTFLGNETDGGRQFAVYESQGATVKIETVSGGLYDRVVSFTILSTAKYENEVNSPFTATVTRATNNLNEALTVYLTSDDVTEVDLPDFVVIPAGELSTTVEVGVLDDNLLDGDQIVTITAVSNQHGELAFASDVLTVLDHERLIVDLETNSISQDTPITQYVGIVTRPNTDIDLPVTVTMISEDANLIAVEETFVIEAGQSSASFSFELDGQLSDGPRNVGIYATAADYQTGQSELAITEFDLSTLPTHDLDSLGVSVFQGIEAEDEAGDYVRSVGDINGDGYDDFVIAAEDAVRDPALEEVGEIYVVFGRPSSYDPVVELADLDGSNGFTIRGHLIDGSLGAGLGPAGDVNGDGFTDLIVAAAGYDWDSAGGNSPFVYVVFGKDTPFEAQFDLQDLDGSNGFAINALTGDFGDFQVEVFDSSGDFNGDGIDDIALGIESLTSNQHSIDDGAVFIIFGKADGYTPVVNLNEVDGENGFIFYGDLGHRNFGRDVKYAGDMNNDGFGDLLVSTGVSAIDAEVFVLFGKSDGFELTIGASEIDGSNGFVISSDDSSVGVGRAVEKLGDVNGDGISDILVRESTSLSERGRAFVLFGHTGIFPQVVSVDTLDGTNGFAMTSMQEGDRFAIVSSTAGDVNGDGIDDLLIGASRMNVVDGEWVGGAIVVFGTRNAFAAEYVWEEMQPADGFIINGENDDDRFGIGISTAGDVNGDGFDDLLIGAYRADVDGKERVGKTYLIYGQDFGGATTHQGNVADNLLTGDTGANTMLGGTGNDTLVGLGGEDVINAGAGDDVLGIADLAFQRLDGGSDFDTLRIDTAGLVLDLTVIPDQRIAGIEQIDICGTGANVLTLDMLEVLNISGTSNTLIVRADVNDQISMGGGWSHSGQEDIDGETFEVYTQGAAILKVYVVDPELSIRDTSGAIGDGAVQFSTDLPQSATESVYVRPAAPDDSKTVEITNVGSSPLVLQQIIVNAPNVTTDLALTTDAADDIVLGVGESIIIGLTYAPTSPTGQSTGSESFAMGEGLVILTNSSVTPIVEITLSGASTFSSDLNYDGAVNFAEIGILNVQFGLTEQDPGFDPALDITGDGAVNFSDLGQLNAEFGLTLDPFAQQSSPASLTAGRPVELFPSQSESLSQALESEVIEAGFDSKLRLPETGGYNSLNGASQSFETGSFNSIDDEPVLTAEDFARRMVFSTPARQEVFWEDPVTESAPHASVFELLGGGGTLIDDLFDPTEDLWSDLKLVLASL